MAGVDAVEIIDDDDDDFDIFIVCSMCDVQVTFPFCFPFGACSGYVIS